MKIVLWGWARCLLGCLIIYSRSMHFTFSGCRETLSLHPHLLSCVNLFVVAACFLISPWTITHRLTLSCGSYSWDGGASLQLAGVNQVSCDMRGSVQPSEMRGSVHRLSKF